MQTALMALSPHEQGRCLHADVQAQTCCAACRVPQTCILHISNASDRCCCKVTHHAAGPGSSMLHLQIQKDLSCSSLLHGCKGTQQTPQPHSSLHVQPKWSTGPHLDGRWGSSPHARQARHARNARDAWNGRHVEGPAGGAGSGNWEGSCCRLPLAAVLAPAEHLRSLQQAGHLLHISFAAFGARVEDLIS